MAIFRKLVGMRENLICSTGVGIGSSWVGDGGGTIVCTGTPEEVAACPGSYTGQYLKKMLG